MAVLFIVLLVYPISRAFLLSHELTKLLLPGNKGQ